MSVVKSQTVSVETVERNPRYWLEQLLAGQTLTLVNSEGVPIAMMISLHLPASDAEATLAWEDRWDALAQKVSQAWKSEEGAVEIVAKMRR